jgi:hypothetical protein
VYNRFNRWPARGFWLKLLDALVDAGAVTRSTAIDSTYVKAQRPRLGHVKYVLAEKGYDADPLRRALRKQGRAPDFRAFEPPARLSIGTRALQRPSLIQERLLPP